MMNLGSDGVYLHEECGTNASRHLPGPKTPVKNTKCRFWGPTVCIWMKNAVRIHLDTSRGLKPRKKIKNTDFRV